MKSMGEEDEAMVARMAAWSAEGAKMDVTLFSPRVQQIIHDYETKVEAERRTRETDLEYLRRTRPDMTDDALIALALWGAFVGKSLRLEA